MNYLLDKAVQERLKATRASFNNCDTNGRTIAYADTCGSLVVRFTDGTWCAVEAIEAYDGVGIEDSQRLEIADLYHAGLITNAECKVATEKKLAKEREKKLEQLNRLKAELEPGL